MPAYLQAKQITTALAERTRELEQLQKDIDKATASHKRLVNAQQKAANKLDNTLASLAGLGTGPTRYPIDDALLASDQPRGDLLPRPTPVKTLPLPEHVRATVLKTWDFCHGFGSLLGLSRCSLEAFIDALQHEIGPSVLLAEVHSALLQLILRDTRGQRLWGEAVACRSCSALNL